MVDEMKRILVINGDIPDFDQSAAAAKNLQERTATKKLQEQLSTNLKMKSIPLQDLSTLAEQVHVATREAATNTDLDMREFLRMNKALRRV